MGLRVSHLDSAEVAAEVAQLHGVDSQIGADDLLLLSLHDLLLLIAKRPVVASVDELVPSGADSDVMKILLADESFAEESR